MSCDASAVLSSLQARALETSEPDDLARTLVEKVHESMPRACWVGVWWLEDDHLVLGPTSGGAAEPARLEAGAGTAGIALRQGKDRVVADVDLVEDGPPLPPRARSRIAVLIRSMGAVIGVLDLVSPEMASFGEVERCILRAVADSFGGLVAVPDAG